jgi:hypothetical protein
VIDALRFEDGGRIFDGRVERRRTARRAAPPQGRPDESREGAWWWFRVSGDAQRYAPFHSAADDTAASVRSRIVAYYADLLARRAQPLSPRRPLGGVGRAR